MISGKGGTGKTSVVAAFAALAGGAVLADCDVDAADLHLVLRPELGTEHEFSGRRQAIIDPDACTACGRCAEVCRFAAVLGAADGGYSVDPIACEGCELCRRVCPADAIHMEPVVNGAWMVSETRFGPLVHARLGVAEDNSGKLVTLVRNEARSVAEERGLPLVIVDGSPGIGCPVIASLAGADLVLAVTEPTVSGRHDLDRVLQVVRQFRLPFAVCVNKADLNPDLGAADRRRGVGRRRGVRRHRRLRPRGDARPGGRHRRHRLWRPRRGRDHETVGGRERHRSRRRTGPATGRRLSSMRPQSAQRLVYGPVPSRRLGRSLGVDLVPLKTCTYDCVYCQLGRTTRKTVRRQRWVDPSDVVAQVRARLDVGARRHRSRRVGRTDPACRDRRRDRRHQAAHGRARWR